MCRKKMLGVDHGTSIICHNFWGDILFLDVESEKKQISWKVRQHRWENNRGWFTEERRINIGVERESSAFY